jgi:hypothetical protein
MSALRSAPPRSLVTTLAPLASFATLATLASLAGGCVIVSGTVGGGGDAAGGSGASSAGGQGGAGASAGSGGAGGSGAQAGAGGAGGEGGFAPVTGFSLYQHSCPGTSRVDALHRDADGTLWLGCGTTQVGYGLHRSVDGGATWSAVATSPADALATFRVSSIERGPDGALTVAGFDASSSRMVLALDTAASPASVSEVLVAGALVDTSFHVGTFRQRSDGSALAESLTGHGALYREGPGVGTSGEDWVNAYYWANDGAPPTYQILDLVTHADGFYGCGSTIAEPPYVFLPPSGPEQEPFELVPVELPNEGWTGEMWGVAASDARVVVVGVDQDADEGKIFVSGADPYEPSGYLVHELSAIVGASGLGTWARGVCMRGDRVVVVGERQPLALGTGLAVLSDDGGQTFVDVTPEGHTAESLSKCVIEPDGTVVLAGADLVVAVSQ